MAMTGCKDDDDDVFVPEPQVNFFASSQIISEHDDEQTINITLDRPAAISGVIKIQVGADHLSRFTTTPAASDGIITLALLKDQSEVQFKLTPMNNTSIDGDETITLTIKEVSEGFTIGTTAKNEILIEDDEELVNANFLLNIGSIRENKAYGLDVVIVLSDFPESEGKATVVYESASAVYGQDFVIEPAPINGKIELTTIDGYDYLMFRVKPLDDQLIDGDMQIKFTLAAASGSLSVGDGKIMNLDLLDDESYALYHVEDVRALYTGESLILDNMYMVGTVTSAKDNVGHTMTYVEDETGGIALRLIFANDFERGDRLRINLGYGLLKENNGVLEVQQVSEADKIGTSPLSYKVRTLEDLFNTAEELEGRLVQLQGVNFTEADGAKTMQGDRIISDGSHTVIVRTLQYASFKDQVVPSGNVTVKGILTEVNGNFIVYPQVFSEDVVAD
jgi:hypothetical protein